MRYEKRKLVLHFLACVTLCGCGGVHDSYVSGTATLDGNPIPRGTVAFNPQGLGPSAYGRIESNGEYSIHTGREEGLPPGQYILTVVANEAPTEEGKDGGPPLAGKPITPPWYRSSTTSGLERTVEIGSNEINLELTSEPPPGYEQPKRRRRR